MNRRPPKRLALLTAALALLYWQGLPPAAGASLMLTGQVMLQNNLAPYDGPDYAGNAELARIKRKLAQVLAVVRNNDSVILELETALKIDGSADKAEPGGRDKGSDFFHEIEGAGIVDLIQYQMQLAPGQAIFTAANNHAGDNGAAGIAAWLALFEKMQRPLAGLGDLAQASAPRYLPPGAGPGLPGRVALVAFATDKVALPARADAAGVNTLSVNENNVVNADDQQRILHNIALAHAQGATVVAYQHNHHWNQKNVNQAGGVEQWRVDFARRCIDGGADVYFAHGEPRLQGIEIYRGKPIFYGLGNFMFQTRKVDFYQAEVWESVLVELAFEPGAAGSVAPPRLKALKLIPLILNEAGAPPVAMQTRGLPALAQGEQALAILTRLQAMSRQLGTRIEIDAGDPTAIVGRILLQP